LAQVAKNNCKIIWLIERSILEMDIAWAGVLYQILLFGLVILFFVGLFRFVVRVINHTKISKETLRRIEEKLDYLIEENKKE
jgi:hypothetical protein